jgi:hypothetical protein
MILLNLIYVQGVGKSKYLCLWLLAVCGPEHYCWASHEDGRWTIAALLLFSRITHKTIRLLPNSAAMMEMWPMEVYGDKYGQSRWCGTVNSLNGFMVIYSTSVFKLFEEYWEIEDSGQNNSMNLLMMMMTMWHDG